METSVVRGDSDAHGSFLRSVLVRVLSATLHDSPCALGDEFRREIQVFVDVGARRRSAESIQADHFALPNPALPAKGRSGLDTQPRGNRRRQDIITIALRLGLEE